MDRKKSFTLILLFIEIIITISVIITWILYDTFWKINGYAFTWFWVKGVLGIIVFIVGMYLWKIKFKKLFIGFLIIPIIFSIWQFVGVIYGIIHPWNIHYYKMDAIKAMCLVLGHPLWIIYLLQEQLNINKKLIGLSSTLTPIMYLIVAIGCYIR